MGHASICARGILAAMIFAGPHETAFAFEEGSGATKPLPPSWHEEAPAIPRGFDLVAIDEKPPKFADYNDRKPNNVGSPLANRNGSGPSRNTNVCSSKTAHICSANNREQAKEQVVAATKADCT